VLTTERLWLRPFSVNDAADLLALDSDPAVRRFVEDGEPVTLERSVEMIEYWLQAYGHSDLFGFFAAIERASGRFLGWFHYRPGDDRGDDEPELGYRLVASAWGQGLATEGSLALIDRGFSTGRIRRVWAETMAVNVASRRVMEKAGLRLVRTFHADWPVRIAGDEEGDVEYAITFDEWQTARSGYRHRQNRTSPPSTPATEDPA
jgi:RimJ/RimL family protein N-acetyltransferase